MSATQTKNLDNYNCSQIESISSDYGLQHPLHYYEETSHRKKKNKQHQEPIPKKQILAHKKPITKDMKPSLSPPPRAITPPPPNPTNGVFALDTRPCLKPSKSVSGDLNHNKTNGSTINHKYSRHKPPPLTSNIAQIEQALKASDLSHKNQSQNRRNDEPQTLQHTNGNIISSIVSAQDNNHSMNKNNASSICSVESLEYEHHKRKLLFNEHKDLEENNKDEHEHDDGDGDEKEASMTIESIHTIDSDHGDHKNHRHQSKRPKIRMWNAVGYGLEDPIEGSTFEWIDSKYVRLLQLSTYSTVMGPKVKFVWKNSEIYNDKYHDYIQHEEDNKTEEHAKNASHSNLRCRPEFAYHELEAWIAKQTLDCTEWKNRHRKNTPPPFTKKTMIAPEFGVVLTCIQFDSSLRALRNKQFNQYINGIYAHHITGKTGGKTPRKNSNDNITHSAYHTPNASYSVKSYSSRYSSPVSSYRPVGDTLADYLSKCAPFSFSAGMAGGMNVSGATVPQVPFNYAMLNQNQPNQQQDIENAMAQPHIDDNEDPDDIGHYSLVLAVEYKYNEKFIECLDGIEHWLYTIATQIRYLLALNKCFKCDQLDHSIHEPLNDASQNEYNHMDLADEDCPDRLHTIIPFMTNIVPTAVFKFDQLFSATFVPVAPIDNDEDISPSRGLPQQISLFDTWFTSTLDKTDKLKLSTMVSSHLQTLGRTVIVGDDEQEMDRYISTLALFSTSQQRSLSRLSVKVDNPYNLCTHYIPELFLQGIVIPSMENNADSDYYDTEGVDNDYNATVVYLQSSSAIKQLQEDLYLAPGPSTLILLASSTKHRDDNPPQPQSFWWIRQTAMPHKFKQEQQGLLFQKLFYLKRRRRDNSTSSYIYARRRSGGPLFDTSPSANHHRTKQRKQNEKESAKNTSYISSEFKSINAIYHTSKALEEEDEEQSTNTISSTMPPPIHAPHAHYMDHNNLTFVEPSLSPMIATIVFGSFNIPQQLKMTFLETQFRILLQKASEILLYIEHEQKELLAFYDKTCHVMSCKDFKEQVPMEALYPQIMQKFESQLRSDLEISRQEDLYVLLSISEGFRPNLFSLMFGNPVFDIEVADILRYFLF